MRIYSHATLTISFFPKWCEVAKGYKCEPYYHYPVHSPLTLAGAEYNLLRYYASRLMASPEIGNGRPKLVVRCVVSIVKVEYGLSVNF